MAEVFMNTCPKCGGPTRLETRNFKQSCSSCNRIAELEAENTRLREAAQAVVDWLETGCSESDHVYNRQVQILNEDLAAALLEKGE